MSDIFIRHDLFCCYDQFAFSSKVHSLKNILILVIIIIRYKILNYIQTIIIAIKKNQHQTTILKYSLVVIKVKDSLDHEVL